MTHNQEQKQQQQQQQIDHSASSSVPLLSFNYRATSTGSAKRKNYNGELFDETSLPQRESATLDKIIAREVCSLYEDYYNMSHRGKEPELEEEEEEEESESRDFKGIPSLAKYIQNIERLANDLHNHNQYMNNNVNFNYQSDRPISEYLGLKKPVRQYCEEHRYWVPHFNVPNRSDITISTASTNSHTEYKVSNSKNTTSDHFFSYLHVQPQMSRSPMPGLYLHTTTALNSHLYTIGGLRPIYTNQILTSSDNLQRLLRSRVRVSADGKIDYPDPLISNALNSVMMIPNEFCYIMSLESHVTKQVDLRKIYLTNCKKKKIKRSWSSENDVAFENNVLMERGLMGMSGDALNDRYVLYYGGFILSRTVEKVDNDVLEVSFHIRENQYVYVMDVHTFLFQKFGLFTHDHQDNYVLNSKLELNGVNLQPTVVPCRFGHTSNVVNLSKHRNKTFDASSSANSIHSTLDADNFTELTAAVYIIGGFTIIQPTEEGTDNSIRNKYSFKVLRDIWKLEIMVKGKGSNNYLQFQDKVLASSVHSSKNSAFAEAKIRNSEISNKFGLGEPEGRAFHITELLDTTVVFGDDSGVENILTKTARIISKTLNPPATTAKQAKQIMQSQNYDFHKKTASATRQQLIFSNERKSQLKLLMHGGINQEGSILGDIWWFDFEQHMWFRLKNYYQQEKQQEKQQEEENFGKETEKLEKHLESMNLGSGKLESIRYEEVQLRKCGHHSFVFDKYLVLMAGTIPSNYKENFQRNLKKNIQLRDISELIQFNTTKLDRTEACQKQLEPEAQSHDIFLLNISNQKWLVYKLFHKYPTIRFSMESPSSTESLMKEYELNLSHVSLLGGTAVVANSRFIYIGGIIGNSTIELNSSYHDAENRQQTNDKLILNNGLVCIDFPLGSFSSGETVRKRRY